MPLFEYACPDCGHVFEKLVLRRSTKAPECPSAEETRSSKFSRRSPRPAAKAAPRVRPRAAADGSELRGQAAS